MNRADVSPTDFDQLYYFDSNILPTDKHLAKDYTLSYSKKYAKAYGNSSDVHRWFMNKDQHAYEVISKNFPCRLYMDIDFTSGTDEYTVQTYHETGRGVVQTLVTTLYNFVGVENLDLFKEWR